MRTDTRLIPVITGEIASPRPHEGCGWCGIRLAAIPDPPDRYRGQWYHPTGCLEAALTV